MSAKSEFFHKALTQSGHLSCKYSDLKRRLALSFPNNPKKYNAEESSFIKNVESLRDLSWWALSSDPVEASEQGYLVVLGSKTATASLLRWFTDEGHPLPVPGTISCLTDRFQNPIAKVEITAVEVKPFGQIDLAFAKKCAIGNRTLETWREEHLKKFSPFLAVSEETEIVCCSFKVIETLDWAYFNPMPSHKFKSTSAIDLKIEI